jgi:hypothetical protein
MLSVLLRPAIAISAETTQQAHHIVIMFWRRHAAAENPIEQIGVGAIEQRFEPVELGPVQALEGLLGKRTENEITLLRPAMPAAEQQPPTADIEMFAL